METDKVIPKALVGQSALLPFLALIAATGFWGSSFITVARTLESTDPFTLVFLRFGVGALPRRLMASRPDLSHSA